MSAHRALDTIDHILLDRLQELGRIKRNELAELTGLSVPAVSERMRKLEEGGFISGYHAHVAPRTIGYDVCAFVSVTIDAARHYASFLNHVHATEEILECHAITGEGTHLIKVRVKNTDALEGLLMNMHSWPGIVRTVTTFVLSTHKESLRVPVPHETKKKSTITR